MVFMAGNVMEDRTYTEQDARDLKRHQQLSLLDKRGIKYKRRTRENGLVQLILDSNPTTSAQPSTPDEVSLKLMGEDVRRFKEILEIAGSGFPKLELLTFIEFLKKKVR